jgi:hypothetical protein
VLEARRLWGLLGCCCGVVKKNQKSKVVEKNKPQKEYY